MSGTLKVDLLGGDAERKARKTTALIAVLFAVVVGITASVGAGASYRAAARGTTVFDEVGNLPVIADIRRLAWGAPVTADGITPDDKMTFLFLGVGGEGHEGSQLTDTILLATVDMTSKKVGIVSLPRDLAFPLGGGRFMKINAVNAYAEQSHPGEGARETANALQDLLSIRIDHVVRVDFHGFVAFIDALDGVDIDVAKSFTDYEYPTEDYKWKTISFTKGPQHMSGATALEYVRSRHGSSGEGSDFARSARQQLVILALREKLLSKGTLTNPQRIAKLYETVAKNVQTDLSAWDLVKLAPMAQGFTRDHVVTNVLTDAPDGELAASNVDGAFMLFPRKPDWSELREIARDPFKTKDERNADFKPETNVRVEIKNGTHITGFANDVKIVLNKNGYSVQGVSNAAFRSYERTVIFDLTAGSKPKELARLKRMLDANVSTTIPAWLTGTPTTVADRVVMGEGLVQEQVTTTSTDFLIVLGDSSRGLVDDYAP